MTTPSPQTPVSWAAVAALFLPLAAGLVLAVLTIAAWAAGNDPQWAPQELTLSEAAMVRDVAEMTRLIHAGADPGRAWPVRDELVDSGHGESITPLEAAIRNDRGEIVALLLREGLRLDAATRDAMLVKARARDANDVVAELERAQVTAP